MKNTEITREAIVQELIEMGYNAQAVETIKNGVVFEGITIKTEGVVSPVIYTHDLIAEAPSLMAAVQEFIDLIEKHSVPSFDTSVFLDRSYVLDNIYIGLQRSSSQGLEKKNTDYEGIEQYLYIRHECATVKVQKGYLENLDIDLVEAWELAKKHTFAETQIVNIGKLLADLQGFPFDDEELGALPMYCVSNRYSTFGAAGILDKELLKEFANSHGIDKMIVLPSSIHEAILVIDDSITPEEATEMVMCVNGENVEAHEQLSDRAYVLEF